MGSSLVGGTSLIARRRNGGDDQIQWFVLVGSTGVTAPSRSRRVQKADQGRRGEGVRPAEHGAAAPCADEAKRGIQVSDSTTRVGGRMLAQRQQLVAKSRELRRKRRRGRPGGPRLAQTPEAQAPRRGQPRRLDPSAPSQDPGQPLTDGATQPTGTR